MKLKKIFLSIFTVACGAIAFTSCNGGGDTPEVKTYTIKWVLDGKDYIEPKVYNEGEEISKPETDPTKEKELCTEYTFDNWYDGETAYVFGSKAVKDVTYTAKFNEETHHSELEHKIGESATCTKAGYKEAWYCDTCKNYYTDEEGKNLIGDESAYTTWKTTGEGKIPELGHKLEKVAGKAATCTEAGYKEAWKCSTCGHYFSDSSGTTEIGDESAYTTWKTTGGGVIPMTGHGVFDSELKCKSCGDTMKTAYGLIDASEEDAIVPMTLSDLGQSEFNFTSSHTFVRYKFSDNGSFELKFKYTYTIKTTNEYERFYLFNNQDEHGLVIRFSTYRTGDCGSDMYIFKGGSSSSITATLNDSNDNIYKTLSTEETDGVCYVPYTAKIDHEKGAVIDVKGLLTNKSTNTYKIIFTINGEQLNKGYDGTMTLEPLTINVTLGANYFDSLSNQCFRFTQCGSAENTVHASDATTEYTSNELVYKDCNGNVYGKKTLGDNDTAPNPTVEKEGYTFLGWCDQNGKEPSDIDTSKKAKYVFTPRFIENTGANEIRQTLSDFAFEGANFNNWFNGWSSNETISTKGIQNATSNTTSIETVYKYMRKSTSDYHAITSGFTYDATDASARVNINNRINNNNQPYFEVFVQGTQKGTRVVYDSSWKENSVYLIKQKISKTNDETNPFNITYSVISLGNGKEICKFPTDFAYTSTYQGDFTDAKYTRMGFVLNDTPSENWSLKDAYKVSN